MRSASSILLAAACVLSVVPLARAQERERGRSAEAGRLPVVTALTSPFFADGSEAAGGDRAFAATVLTKTARVPAAWPLVIQASILVDGDPPKGPLGDARCALAIDGHRAAVTPVPQLETPITGDEAGRDPLTRGTFPDLLWRGTFTAGPIPPGLHTFTLECESSTPFQMRGTAALKVSGNPSRR